MNRSFSSFCIMFEAPSRCVLTALFWTKKVHGAGAATFDDDISSLFDLLTNNLSNFSLWACWGTFQGTRACNRLRSLRINTSVANWFVIPCAVFCKGHMFILALTSFSHWSTSIGPGSRRLTIILLLGALSQATTAFWMNTSRRIPSLSLGKSGANICGSKVSQSKRYKMNIPGKTWWVIKPGWPELAWLTFKHPG